MYHAGPNVPPSAALNLLPNVERGAHTPHTLRDPDIDDFYTAAASESVHHAGPNIPPSAALALLPARVKRGSDATESAAQIGDLFPSQVGTSEHEQVCGALVFERRADLVFVVPLQLGLPGRKGWALAVDFRS